MTKILLGQLGSNGDCLYATILARQLRYDYPDAHITWAVSSLCADVIRNNPHIDEAWIVPVRRWDEQALMWRAFEREAFRRQQAGSYDRVLLSQIWPNNFQNYDGTVRPSILRSYGGPITVPIENVVVLTDAEIGRAEKFVDEGSISAASHRILFECSAKSGQSSMTPELAQDVAEHFYRLVPDSVIIFNSHLPMALRDARSRYSGALSLRESAWLTRHCSLFVGCGSGATVAATSTAATSLPMIQLLSSSSSVFGSLSHDLEYFGIPNNNIVEITDERPEIIAKTMATACIEGISAASAAHHCPVSVGFKHYFLQLQWLLKVSRYLDAAKSLRSTAFRYGWTTELLQFAQTAVSPNLRLDPRWIFKDCRSEGDAFREEISAAAVAPARDAVQVRGGYRQLGVG